MADGVNILDASGSPVPVASDDTPKGQVQFVKIDLGEGGENSQAAGTLPVSGTVGVNNFPATQPVSAAALPLPSGAATAASQATLETLIDTLQELAQRLAPLGSVVNYAGGVALRIVPSATVAVSGPITSANSIAEKNVGGVSYPQRVAAENLTAHQANIINCTAA